MMKFITEQIDERDCRVLHRLVGEYARPNMIVFELGTYTGRSALAMLPHIRRVNGRLYCVDWFKGNPGVGGMFAESFKEQSILDVFLSNISAAGFKEYVNVLVGETDRIAKIIADETADFIFIDADHRYTHIKSDIINWYPKLKKGGLLCGHDFEKHLHECNYQRALEKCEEDYVDNHHYGVIRAVCEFFPNVRREGTIWFVKKERLLLCTRGQGGRVSGRGRQYGCFQTVTGRGGVRVGTFQGLST